MTLREEYMQAVKLEASGAVGGTRSTYLEWLMERQVILLAASMRLRAGGEDDEPEDADGADPE